MVDDVISGNRLQDCGRQSGLDAEPTTWKPYYPLTSKSVSRLSKIPFNK